MFGLLKKPTIPSPDAALPGRPDPIPTAETHFVNNNPLKGPYPDGLEVVDFGLGCFWGAERIFWKLPGVWVTAVGYGAGSTPNPTYKEVCTGMTGHNELVRVVYDPDKISFDTLLATFFESHDPTQGMRQGNDIGTQYRSGIYTADPTRLEAARSAKAAYDARLRESGYSAITTEIQPLDAFYFAEDYHQQYLAKNPDGYCGIGGTGVTCPVGNTAS